MAAALLLVPMLLLATEAAARTINDDGGLGYTVTVSPSSPVIYEGQTVTYTVTGNALT